ncbi:MFS transporter [uncultured Methanobrevibacter sp.]|uniref:MFS transporter n=1 Tax=uncultured Methanobrevibacter sp. TaxID=253161 RepID=UPI0025D9DEA3|nr:MFS transporter [uncultured Methanobrevibacter sp.]
MIGNFAAMSGNFVIFIVAYTLNLYLQIVLGLDTRFVGLLLLITPIVMIFISPLAGRLSDKHNNNMISAIAMIIIGVSLVILVSLDVLPFYMIIVAFIIQGVGYGLFASPNNKNVLTSVSIDDLSDASALLSAGKDIGKLLSLCIFNIFCEFFVNTQDLNDEMGGLYFSIKSMMMFCIILVILCIIFIIISKFKLKMEKSASN